MGRFAESRSDDPDIAQTVSACVGSVQGLAPSAAQLSLSSLDPALCGSTDTLMLLHELELL